MKRRFFRPLWIFAAGVPVFSCSGLAEMPGNQDSSTHVVKAGISGYASGESAVSGEGLRDISGITGYLFRDGVFERVYDDCVTDGNTIEIGVEKAGGRLYIVARHPDAPEIGEPEPGTPESRWEKTVISSHDPGTGMFFTGKADLDKASGTEVRTSLTRGAARIDLKVAVAGNAEIREIILENIAQEAYLFPGNEPSSPENAATGEIAIRPQSPLTSDTEGIAYILEQSGTGCKVSMTAEIDGKEYRLGAMLPETVRRNTVYSVTLRKGTIDSDVELSVEQWGDGGQTDLTPDRDRILTVDLSRSDLPEGADVEDGGTVVTLPHLGTEFTLAVESDDELELLPAEGHLLSVEPVPGKGPNLFKVTKALYAPGDPASETILQIRLKGFAAAYPEDRIVLKLEANPSSIEGTIGFGDGNYTYDFGGYADNLFGIITPGEGKKVEIEFGPGEDPWIKLDPYGDKSYRILGGWRPNDPAADGRRQTATLVISDQDGAAREEYTIARKNYGMPVVWLQGIWWCKYNAMGDSRDFEDQVLCPDDPAALAGKTLYEYLGSCTAEEYARLWGWAYQGDSGKGMRVVEQDGKAVMEGFRTGNKTHINKLPADALAPPGYELPSMEDFNRVFDATDYVWVMWNGTHTLKSPWEGHATIRREQRRKNGIQVGTMSLQNLIYIAMWSPDFPDREPVVWYGPGAQWNDDGILHAGHYNNILFGVHSPEGSGWYIAGGMENLYLHKNGAGNNDTRILRFRKSDVEYIY